MNAPETITLEVAHNLVYRALRSGDIVQAFEPHRLRAWEVLRKEARPSFDGLASELTRDQRATLYRRLDEIGAGKIDSPVVAANCSLDEWPGDGLVAGYFMSAPSPIRWFARERLLAGRAQLLVGLGGSSKTRVLYHLAIAAVLGRLSWGWRIDQTGSAALFLAEDTADAVHRTLVAMTRSLGVSDAEESLLSERLRIFPLAGKESRLLTLVPGGDLRPNGRLDRLMEAVAGMPAPAVFIGLDPALGLTEGDEMNPGHQRRLGELADRIAIDSGACVLLAAHAAKGSATADEVGTHTSRGSGAITDAVRGEFVLRTMTAAEGRQFGITEIDERRAFVQLAATKGNDMPPSAFAPIWLKRTAGGVLEEANLAKADDRPVAKRELEALNVLRELAQTSSPTLKAWREACMAAGLLQGTTDAACEKAMQRIRDALLDAGLVEPGMTRGVFLPVDQR